MEAERLDIPCVIGGEEVRTGDTVQAVMPHRKEHVLADVHQGGAAEVERAVKAAAEAWQDWSRTPWEERAAVLLRAAELLAGPWRTTLVAATMLNQSKTAHQAEIDAACELIDFFRFNVEFMTRVYSEQPISSPGVWNRLEYRPLEGFVFAVSPFNFTAIGGNLTTSPGADGERGPLEARVDRRALGPLHDEAAPGGRPSATGVINLVYGRGSAVGDPALAQPRPRRHPLHRLDRASSRTCGRPSAGTSSSTATTRASSARPAARTSSSPTPPPTSTSVATAIVRGSFEYQGQKCSAASRVYAPSNLWPELRERLAAQVAELKVGDVGDFGNFMGAVIDAGSFATQKEAIEEARAHGDSDVLVGGGYDDSEGFFVQPTVIETRDPNFRLLRDELFGPVVTAYVYPENDYEETLDLVDRTAPYGLTGAVFARDRSAIELAGEKLQYAAGNFYVNDKPTGAVVGQQPFGGARASGTNDKAGSMWNLIRWVSPRTIKETFVPPTDYRYPFMSRRRHGRYVRALREFLRRPHAALYRPSLGESCACSPWPPAG